jgi:UDP:flavonoid glycosyltransferase YjiC (YdhE family)
MHGIINNFRKNILGLPSIHGHRATNIMIDEKVPHTYCWSTALAPKPSDWGSHINVSGFFFLDLGTAYTNPPQDLLDFLNDNQDDNRPIYIGFGSITGHDSRRILGVVLEALHKTGYRALLSGLATDQDHLPNSLFKIGNVPHDWLFQYG